MLPYHSVESIASAIHLMPVYLEIKENLVITNRGNITANNIVVATNYPIMNAPGYYFMKMHQERSYIIALENADNVNGMYIDVEKN